MDLNKFGKRAYKCAVKRKKILENSEGILLHSETVQSLNEEVKEVAVAGETDPSDHLDNYTAVAEELADVAIVVMTELYRRGIDIEAILHEKMKYNEQR